MILHDGANIWSLFSSGKNISLNFFHYIDMSVSKIKKKLDEKQRRNKRMTSVISSLVRIWKISHSYPGCSFVWKIRVVYFSVKHSYLCNKYNYLRVACYKQIILTNLDFRFRFKFRFFFFFLVNFKINVKILKWYKT